MWKRTLRRKRKPRKKPNEVVAGVSKDDFQNLTTFLNQIYRDIVLQQPGPKEIEYEFFNLIDYIERNDVFGGFVHHILEHHYEKYIARYACFQKALQIPYFRNMFSNTNYVDFFQVYNTIYFGYFSDLYEKLKYTLHNMDSEYPDKSKHQRKILKEQFEFACKRYEYFILRPGNPVNIDNIACHSSEKRSVSQMGDIINNMCNIIDLLVDAQYSEGNSFGFEQHYGRRRGRLVRKHYRGFV